jgi:hypothetical protein
VAVEIAPQVGPTDDTEVMTHLAFFGVVLWGETRERAPPKEECGRILRVMLAPLAGIAWRHARAQTGDVSCCHHRTPPMTSTVITEDAPVQQHLRCGHRGGAPRPGRDPRGPGWGH